MVALRLRDGRGDVLAQVEGAGKQQGHDNSPTVTSGSQLADHGIQGEFGEVQEGSTRTNFAGNRVHNVLGTAASRAVSQHDHRLRLGERLGKHQLLTKPAVNVSPVEGLISRKEPV